MDIFKQLPLQAAVDKTSHGIQKYANFIGAMDKFYHTITEELGLITRAKNTSNRYIDYKVTEIGEELFPIVLALRKWAHRNIDSEVALENIDAKLLI